METLNKVTPKTKQELRTIIERELKRQGTDADLNFIDTSKITDMSYLFYGLNIGKIKIDKWDVSNVTKWKACLKGVINLTQTCLIGTCRMSLQCLICFLMQSPLMETFPNGMCQRLNI